MLFAVPIGLAAGLHGLLYVAVGAQIRQTDRRNNEALPTVILVSLPVFG